MERSFRHFLLEREPRDAGEEILIPSLIEDLYDGGFRPPHNFTPKDVSERLDQVSVCDEAKQALDELAEEWRALIR